MSPVKRTVAPGKRAQGLSSIAQVASLSTSAHGFQAPGASTTSSFLLTRVTRCFLRLFSSLALGSVITPC